MAQRGTKGIRASFSDALAELERATEIKDPAPSEPRDGYKAGQWPGSPVDRLPPACPVTPLGVDGKVSFFIDSLGQLIPVASGEWGKKILLQLFASRPNYLQWAWPRFNAKTYQINGLEVDEAMQCLIKAAASRGIFSASDRVRGRGAWLTKQGAFLWHAGDRIFRVEGQRLEAAAPGEIDGIFYPQRPAGIVPWQSPVGPDDSPVADLLDKIRTWNWERPVLDPLLVIGWLGCAFAGGALAWRPHLYTTGDKGVGKSTLHAIIKEILGASLHSTSETTPAGIYQRVKQDSLPVAIDELEASDDNRRVMAVVSLARLASSGALMYRGGAEHEGVEFQLRNTFFMSGINPPPMTPADKSRLAILNLGKLRPDVAARRTLIDPDVIGRMILRAVMDGWPRFGALLADWKGMLRLGGLDSRGQDTWGTLLAMSHLLLGDEGIEAAGIPIDSDARVGRLVSRATAYERAEALDNWVGCLHHLFSSPIQAWKGGEQPSIGRVLEDWESGTLGLKEANERLRLVDLAVQEREIDGNYDNRGLLLRQRFLAIPIQVTPGLDRLFQGKTWAGGVWGTALKQAPPAVVRRDLGGGQVVKINRKPMRCLLLELDAYDRHMDAMQQVEMDDDDD